MYTFHSIYLYKKNFRQIQRVFEYDFYSVLAMNAAAVDASTTAIAAESTYLIQ